MMRAPARLLLLALVATATLAAPVAQAAQPVERWERMVESERYEDVVEQARKWLEKNADHALVPDVRRVLAEAEYQLLLKTPSVDKVVAYRDEFPDGPREADAFALHANMSLYAASDEGTEAAYRAVADSFPGTPGALEALARAEEAGFNESVADGSAEAMARFLGNYPDSPNFATAQRLWRTRGWDEAEDLNTLQAWTDLRLNDAEHPRAEEAWLREQALALAELPVKPSTEALLRLARRYEGTPTGWETLRRVIGRSGIRLSTGSNQTVLETTVAVDHDELTLVEAGTVLAVSLEPPGRLPDSAELAFGLQVEIDGKDWIDWNERAALHAGSWGGTVEPPPERVGPALHWLTSATPCLLPHVTGARIRVGLRQESKKSEWTLPVSLSNPCGGVVPLAVRYAPGGIVDATAQIIDAGIDPVVRPVEVQGGGLAWSCAGSLHVEDSGLWLTCSGWQVSRWGEGLMFRPPPLGVASATGDPSHAALTALPNDGTQRWLALDVPTAWHFGGGPVCPLPDSPVPPPEPPATTTEAPADASGEAPVEVLVEAPAEADASPPEPPPVPLWVHPSLEKLEDRTEDVDGDGRPDRITFLAPRGGHPAWIVVVLASFPADLSWTAPWREDLPPEGSQLRLEECGYRVVGPEM